jgi:hypothetical protein
LHEVGKPVVFELNARKSFNGHEIEGAKRVDIIARRLKMSKEEAQALSHMVEDHLKFKDVFQMREATLERLIREEHFEELLNFHKADAMASDGNLAFYEFSASRLESYKKAPQKDAYKLVDGKDLIQLGFSPGPEFSEILHTVEDLALERQLKSKEEALEYIVKNFVK